MFHACVERFDVTGYACVKKFDVTDTVGNFLRTKQGLNTQTR